MADRPPHARDLDLLLSRGPLEVCDVGEGLLGSGDAACLHDLPDKPTGERRLLLFQFTDALTDTVGGRFVIRLTGGLAVGIDAQLGFLLGQVLLDLGDPALRAGRHALGQTGLNVAQLLIDRLEPVLPGLEIDPCCVTLSLKRGKLVHECAATQRGGPSGRHLPSDLPLGCVQFLAETRCLVLEKLSGSGEVAPAGNLGLGDVFLGVSVGEGRGRLGVVADGRDPDRAGHVPAGLRE